MFLSGVLRFKHIGMTLDRNYVQEVLLHGRTPARDFNQVYEETASWWRRCAPFHV